MYPRNFKLNDVVKNTIAIILKYYRKKLKLNQRDFITYNQALICSMDSYSRIENLHPIKSDSIYIYLLHQIDATIDYDPLFWSRLIPLHIQLRDSILSFDIAKTEEIAITIKNTLPSNSKDIFVRETTEVMEFIIDYYKNQTSTIAAQEKYNHLFSIFSEPLQDILADILFRSTLQNKLSMMKIKETYTLVYKKDASYLLHQINHCIMLYYEKQYLDCFKEALILEQRLQQTKNYNRLFEVYVMIAYLYVNIQGLQATEYQEKLEKLIQHHASSLHPLNYILGLMYCGDLAVMHKDYTLAYEYYTKCFSLESKHLVSTALKINAIISCAKLPSDLLIIEDITVDETLSKRELIFYKYYQMKKDAVEKTILHSYLLKQVLPSLKKNEELYLQAYKNEIAYCS